MPGIAGLITQRPKAEALNELNAMLGVLQHDPTYRTGIWHDVSSGVYLGWVERKEVFCQGMPLANETGDVLVAFSGEELADPALIAQLKARGHQFESSRLDYLVHWYEEDALFPAGLNGRFHGLVADKRRGTTLLFADRFGMHRLYYHEAKDAFYFAAEAKAILAVRPELRRPDLRGIGEFAACGAVLEGRSMFEGIASLPGGSLWEFGNGLLVRKGRYFSPSDWESEESLNPETYYRELRATFRRNLPRHFAGEQTIAMALTGGLDTRMILANYAASPGELPCYTFGSMLRETQDVRIARRVAAVCGQPFQELTAGHDFLSKFPWYAERAVYLTDGCLDVSHAADQYLNERASAIAPVRITGNYGSEILRGVRAFKAVQPAEGFFSPDFQPWIQQAGETYAGAVQCHPVSFAAFRQLPWHLGNTLALDETQLTVRSPYLDNDLVRLAYRSPLSELSSDRISRRLVADSSPALAAIPTDRAVGGSASKILRIASRKWQAFTFKAEYASDMGMPQWLARLERLMSPLQPTRAFLGRHKAFHFRTWYRDPLAEYVRGVLLDPVSVGRSYIDRARLEKTIERHFSGAGNYTNEIHKLLTLELMHRSLIGLASGQATVSLGMGGKFPTPAQGEWVREAGTEQQPTAAGR